MADLDNKKIVVIGGPTASGKSNLAIKLAQRFGGEIISADSMQIYRGLDIGTGKVTDEEKSLVPHHMIDILDPWQEYSVADYCRDAAAMIEDVLQRNKLPIICGGTGLYISSLLNGIDFSPVQVNAEITKHLEEEYDSLGAGTLYKRLLERDPDAAKKIHPNNRKRLIRALAVMESTGLRFSQVQEKALSAEKPYNALLICVCPQTREKLYENIDRRVDKMVEQGVTLEAEKVYMNREKWKTAVQAIGYKEFFPLFSEHAPLADCVENLKCATRHYAKRQLTWFRHMPEVKWIYGTSEQYLRSAEELLKTEILQ